MKKYSFLIATLAMVTAGSSAIAAPDNKADHAAQPSSGQSCYVHASDTDPYLEDPDCNWHSVVNSNKDGTLKSYRYQDKGSLQDGQTAPDRAVRIPLEGFIVGGLECTGTEVITPSGSYSSNLKCS